MTRKTFVISMLYLSTTYVSLQASNPVITAIGVGDTPSSVAVTADNKFAYVANNNNDAIVGGNTVSVLDLTTNTLKQTISDASFSEPYTVTINPAGTKVYVTNSDTTTITIIDVATNSVIGTIPNINGPSDMVINPADPAVAYVSNYGTTSGTGNTISVIDLNSNTVTDTIFINSVTPPYAAPNALAITPDGAYVYTVNYVDGNPGTGTVSVIRTSDNQIVDTITGFSGPFEIAITPNGKYAYVTNFGSNNFSPYGTTVSVIDLSINQISATINLGIQPAGVAITPDGRFAYVTNYNTLYLGAGYTDLTPGVGTVNIIDTATNQVLSTVIIVGASPSSVAISPDGRRAYVTNYSSNNVSVIDIVDKMWLGTCS